MASHAAAGGGSTSSELRLTIPPRLEGTMMSRSEAGAAGLQGTADRAGPHSVQWRWELAERTDRFLNHVIEKHHLHELAFNYFRARYVWWSLIPSATLTLLSSLLSILAQSPDFKGNGSMVLLAIGVLTALATFLQAFASAVRYQSRSDMHRTAALRFRDLWDNIERKKMVLGTTRESVEDTEGDIKLLEERFAEMANSCDSVVPLTISRQFSSLYAVFDGEIGATYKTQTYPADCMLDYNRLWRMMMLALFSRVSGQWFWPWWNSDQVMEAVKDVKKSLSKDRGATARAFRGPDKFERLEVLLRIPRKDAAQSGEDCCVSTPIPAGHASIPHDRHAPDNLCERYD